jgi:hypothetical protein
MDLGHPRTLSAKVPDAVTHQNVQDLTDGGLLAGRFGQREMRLDLVPVAPAVLLLDDVTGAGPGRAATGRVPLMLRPAADAAGGAGSITIMRFR